MGIVSIPNKSKNKQIFTDRVRNDRVRYERVRNDRGLEMIVNQIIYTMIKNVKATIKL